MVAKRKGRDLGGRRDSQCMFHILERGVRDLENVQVDERRPSSAPQVEHAGSSSFEGVWMSSDSPHCCVYSGASFFHLRAYAQKLLLSKRFTRSLNFFFVYRGAYAKVQVTFCNVMVCSEQDIATQ